MTILSRAIVLALASGLALSGCSPSPDEVNDAVADLPGVISAEPACHEFQCTVEIEAEATASADELADMLAAARTVDDAWDVEVSLAREEPGRVSARLELASAPVAEDPAVGALLAWAGTQQRDLTAFTVERGTEENIHITGSSVDSASAWPLAREAWALSTDLAGPVLEFSRPGGHQQQSLRVEDTFPEGPVAVAEELEADGDGPTGVLITDDRFLVGAISRSAAERLRPLLAGEPRLGAVTTEVVVTTNVLMSATAAEPGTSQRLEPVLAALDSEPEVLFVTLEGSEIVAEVDGIRSFPRLVERVRHRASAAFVDTTLVLDDPDAGHRVEITPEGDDAVLDLMLALLPTPGLRSMGVGQELEPNDTRAAVSLGVNLRQAGPGTGSAPPVGPEVTHLARLLSETPGSAASYSLSVTIEDADGRSADAGWRVDRAPDGFVLGEISGTVETQAEVRAAWAQGVG